MKKFNKIAMAAVSTVMAGTLVFSAVGCGPKKDDGFKPSAGADNYHILNKDGSINYEAYKRDQKVTLTTAVGNNSATTSISHGKDIGNVIKLSDGNDYGGGSVKPAWVQMGKDLNITWNDVYQGKATSANLETLLTNDKDPNSTSGYSKVDMFTTDLSKAVEYKASGTDILNLGNYLDSMPNFKLFLESNPVVYLSLLQDGMVTEGENAGEGKTLYVAPYFDGNDDIERYCLVRKDWAAKVLNGSSSTGAADKYSEKCSTSTYVLPFMGGENYEVDSLSKDGKSVIKIKKDYKNVKAKLGDANSAIAKAYNAIAGKAYDGTTGNIVEVMNKALEANKDATGALLADLFRAYIDECYRNADGSAHFAADSRADLFNGYDACWDVDDLVAMLRVIKTNESVINPGKQVVGIVPRDSTNDRTPDMVRLACQLYGVRGADSRYEYTYVTKDGQLKDARTDKAFYEAFDRMNLLVKEGLVVDYSGIMVYTGAAYSGTDAKKPVDAGTTDAFFMYDYCQTQTINGFYAEDSNLTGTTVQKGYNFSPIITPVSKWDVDGDGNNTDIMRFTESWRSTKVSGLALNGALAKEENKAKLDAALQFVDYLYSLDGQIVSTFGPMAESADGKGGFWYNAKATDAQVAAGEYFAYKGVKYAGYKFKGQYWPTITEGLYNSFKGLSSNDYLNIKGDYNISGAKLNFTNYARMLIGSTLPVGVKSQAFETQLTSKMGQQGAGVVGEALNKGVIKGMTLKINNANLWYTCVPTGLPVSSALVKNVLNSADQAKLKYITGNTKGDKQWYSIMNWIILKGTNDLKYLQQGQSVEAANLQALYDLIVNKTADGGLGAQSRIDANATGWTKARAYWTFISDGKN